MPLQDEPPIRLEAWQHLHHLPDLNGHACFTARLDTPVLGDEWQMVPLRASFDVLPASLYNMAGKAREILYWDQIT